MASKYNRPNGKLFGSSATNIGVFGSGQQNETPTTSTDPNTINGLGTHWEEGWNGAVVSQAPYTAPYVEDMNAVNYVNSYNSAYLLQKGIPEYSATEEYHEDSVCTYGGEIWICLQDNTPAGTTPTESVYWHQQTELPAMADKRILVGSVGNTATVVDTSGQGDVEASSSGLNIKSNVIVNADVNSSAGIKESKLSLDYSTSNLNTAITNHTGDTNNPHSVTKSQVLSGDPIVNADVDAGAGIEESKLALDYATDTLNTNIGNVSTNLGNHTGDKNNPHETGISNLDDVTISTPIQDGDGIFYDQVSGKFLNKQPAGGSMATLSDTTVTTPIADKSLMQYNLGDTKWENTTEVWDTITANEIAYFGTTPQGRTLDGNNNVTMLATDNRYQILTASDGYSITLPSTDVKSGDTFVFDWTSRSSIEGYSTPFTFYSSNGTLLVSAYIGFFRYEFTAINDTPTANTDWYLRVNQVNEYVFKSGVDYKGSISLTANQLYSQISSALFSLAPAVWEIGLRSAYCNMTPTAKNGSRAIYYDSNNAECVLTYADTSMIGSYGNRNYTEGRSEGSVYTTISSNGNLGHASPYSVTGIFNQIYARKMTIYIRNNLTSSVATTNTTWYQNFIWARLIAPITGSVNF